MKKIRVTEHILLCVFCLFLMVGLPFLTSDKFQSMTNADAVSSASLILDQPSGQYYIFINKKVHTDQENLEKWKSYLTGGDVAYIFEDITCLVAEGDVGASDMADSFKSRLPENQMTIRKENSIMVLSMMEQEQFDILIMSKEFADSYQAVLPDDSNVVTLQITGGSA